MATTETTTTKGQAVSTTTNDTKTYNGWTNYETWVVNLWMSNDEGTYRHWQETTREIVEECGEEDRSRAMHLLASRLESEHDEHPVVTAAEGTVYADLLTAALGEVNWHEIATSLIEEVLS